MSKRNTEQMTLVVWRWEKDKIRALAAERKTSMNALMREAIASLPEPKKVK